MPKSLILFSLILCITSACKRSKLEDNIRLNIQGFTSPFDSLFLYLSKTVSDDQSIFVFINNIDAISGEIYVISKKQQKSDFKYIGTPLIEYSKNGKTFYIYTGLEKIMSTSNDFFVRNHIYEDSIEQTSGLVHYNISFQKAYLVKEDSIFEMDKFDNKILFISKPRRDTLKLY